MNWQKVWDHLFWMTKESRLETKCTDSQNLWNYNKWYENIFIEVHKEKRKKKVHFLCLARDINQFIQKLVEYQTKRKSISRQFITTYLHILPEN